ncbi:MAG: site-specific integrase [Nitrospirales bacterium]
MKTLRQQMDDAMVLRGFALRTCESYLAAVSALAKYYHRSPDLLTPEEVQAWLLHLIVERKLAYASVNQMFCACRFLFDKVLRRPQSRFDIPMAKVPKSLPRVLSREEVSRVLAAAARPHPADGHLCCGTARIRSVCAATGGHRERPGPNVPQGAPGQGRS